MKKAAAVVLVLVVGFVVGRLSIQLPVNAQVKTVLPKPCLPDTWNGNTNNSDDAANPVAFPVGESPDVGDAVYLLNWLFTGGPPPCVITTGSPGDTVYPGCIGAPDRFVDNRDGTVTDNCTGLMWTRDQVGVFEQQEAIGYCERIEIGDNGMGGMHDDWRLPTVEELSTIVDYSRSMPAIDPVFRAESAFYWSSTPHADVSTWAWDVRFDDGGVAGYLKNIEIRIRAVRTVQ